MGSRGHLGAQHNKKSQIENPVSQLVVTVVIPLGVILQRKGLEKGIISYLTTRFIRSLGFLNSLINTAILGHLSNLQ